jgi:hypothetical protein
MTGRTHRYRGEFDTHPTATRRLLDVLNDPTNESKLTEAEVPHDRPALTGIVQILEADPAIAEVLASGKEGYRFRQDRRRGRQVEDGIPRLAHDGKEGIVKGSRYFTKAEHYQPAPHSDTKYAERALAGLDAVTHIGDEDERRASASLLMQSLASTRAHEGRPF